MTNNTGIDAFFTSISKQYNPTLEEVDGIYRFDFGDRQVFMEVHNGKVSLSPKTLNPDCVISCSSEDFIEITRGQKKLFDCTYAGKG